MTPYMDLRRCEQCGTLHHACQCGSGHIYRLPFIEGESMDDQELVRQLEELTATIESVGIDKHKDSLGEVFEMVWVVARTHETERVRLVASKTLLAMQQVFDTGYALLSSVASSEDRAH